MQSYSKDEIMVSIVCLAYNHEKFIAKTLEGFVSQKADFKFEVFVHDDASTDHTADIIKEYAANYPDIIKPVYQTDNQYKKKIGITKTFLFPRFTGKYVAWCEGDDYWTYPLKLQEQVDALENNPSCAACFSRVQTMSYDEVRRESYFPKVSMQTGIIENIDYYRYTLGADGFPWQISGFMVKQSTYREYVSNEPDYRKYFEVGDLPLFLYAGLKGDIYYIDIVMSCYRTGNPESYLGKSNKNKSEKAKYLLRKAEAYRQFDAYTGYKYHEFAEVAINSHVLSSFKKSRNLKGLKSKELRAVYDKLSLKEKVKLHIYCYFPWIEALYHNIIAKIKSIHKK